MRPKNEAKTCWLPPSGGLQYRTWFLPLKSAHRNTNLFPRTLPVVSENSCHPWCMFKWCYVTVLLRSLMPKSGQNCDSCSVGVWRPQLQIIHARRHFCNVALFGFIFVKWKEAKTRPSSSSMSVLEKRPVKDYALRDDMTTCVRKGIKGQLWFQWEIFNIKRKPCFSQNIELGVLELTAS